MPITPTFRWEESDDTVDVVVTLPGASRSRSDVFATDCLLKVNLAPYLLLLDLAGEVDGTRTVATFTAQEGVHFKLHKASEAPRQLSACAASTQSYSLQTNA
jgi:hypothetical protein